MRLFGFEIRRQKDMEVQASFVPPDNSDGAVDVASTSAFGTYLDLDGSVRDEASLVNKYREMSEHPDIDTAIENITTEAIVTEEGEETVEIILDDVPVQDPNIKKIIEDEFKEVSRLLEFKRKSYQLFRRWYIDGRLYFHVVIDEEQPQAGIQELRYIDPRKIRKVRKLAQQSDPNQPNLKINNVAKEYFIYNENSLVAGNKSLYNAQSTQGVYIAKDSILHVTSGLTDINGKLIVSYLHSAIRYLNIVRHIEDAVVIYRLSRAPERRVFYIDVGDLPKAKAEQYLREQMIRHKNKVVYDSVTGCLAMDTKVPLLDGRTLTISEIASEFNQGKKLWAYSTHPETGEFAPGLITWAGVTQESAKVMKLTLDNGESVTCTLDHKFPVWGKGFVEARDLEVGSSIIPLKRDGDKFFNHLSDKWELLSDHITNSIHSGKFDNHIGIVTAIEYLDKPIQVGTLSIDGDEIYHDWHTFALDCGIYTKNSVRDNRKFLTMIEDYYLPRREGGRGTQIDTLPAAQNLSQIEDLEHFQKRLYKSLKVPFSRMEPETVYNIGRTSEITRDEVNFARFIDKLRLSFSELFLSALEKQLILKGIMLPEEWDYIKEFIRFRYLQDNYFAELKQFEILSERTGRARELMEFVGKTTSVTWIRKNIFKQTDEDIEDINNEILAEMNNPMYASIYMPPELDQQTGE